MGAQSYGRRRSRRAILLLAILAVVAAGAVGIASGSGQAPGPASGSQAPGSPWRLKLFDNFRHGISPARWGLYSGPSQGDPGGWFGPAHVTVVHGVLDLAAYKDPKYGGRWVSGGMSSAPALNHRHGQVYGKFEVRLRVSSGYGVGSDVLLWPSSGSWPPEVDFAENDGVRALRSEMHAFVHYGAHNNQVQMTTRGHFSHWHTFGAIWTPGRLVFTVDGRVWGRVLGTAVPSTPMEMDIQDVAGTCGVAVAPCPNSTTPSKVDLQVAWARIYAYRPATHQ